MQSFIIDFPSPAKLDTCTRSVPDATGRQWTAARCNRLLRPLSSKLALLRRERQLLHHGEQEKNLSRRKASVPSNVVTTDNESDEMAAKPEEDWPCPRPKKRTKRTYSSRDIAQARRKRIAESQIDRLNDVPLFGISTIEIPQQEWKGQIRKSGQASLSQATTGLPLSVGATVSKHAGFQPTHVHDRLARTERLKLIEGISSSLSNFLRATSEGSYSAASSSGTRSLFSTCLRRVPEYISDEELECKSDESEKAIGISSTIYNNLEAFGLSPGGGWKPLREVVRSHGINLLGAAINQGYITPPEARYFVNVCLRCRAFDEAERLVEYILNAANRGLTPPAPVISVFDLGTLDFFARATFRYGFQYRQLTRLLRDGYLPCVWMARSEMVPCWNRLIVSLTKANYESIDAAILLRTASSMGYRVSGLPFAASQIDSIRLHAKGLLCNHEGPSLPNGNRQRRPDNALNLNEDLDQAFSATSLHLLTVLTTVEILPSLSSLLETSGPRKADVLEDLALDVLQTFEVNEFETNSGKASQLPRHHDRLYLPVLAARMVLATARKKEHKLKQDIYQHLDLLKCFEISQEFVDTAASFLCTIANCCGQAGSGDAFYYIQEIINLLTGCKIFCPGSNLQIRRLFEQIAVTAAVRFSQATSLPKHLSWALDLESTYHCVRIGQERQTPIRPSERKPKNGFKWEEGICEWVAGTPCIATPKPKVGAIAAPVLSRERGTTHESCFYPTPSPSIEEEASWSPTLESCAGKEPLGEISDCLQNPEYFSHVKIEKSILMKSFFPAKTSSSKLSTSKWFLRVEIKHSSRRKCETILQEAPTQKNSNSEIPLSAYPPLPRTATHIKPLSTNPPPSQKNLGQLSSSSSSKSFHSNSTKKRHRPILQASSSSSSSIATKKAWIRRIPLAAIDTNNAQSAVDSEDELGVL